jgi:UDP-glucose 4-epimerase
MQVLLTGGTGFVGINIAMAMLEKGIDVVMYAASPLHPRMVVALQGMAGQLHFVEGNVLDKDRLDHVFTTYPIDAVIHGAAITPNEQREISAGAMVVQVNCVGTVEVLEAAHRHDVTKFIYLSSIAAYGSATKTAALLQEEITIPEPINLYEITKFTAERIALRYKQLLGMNIISARLGDVFGPWEYQTGMRDVMSAPFQTTQLALLGQKAVLPRSGYKHWVNSKDVAESVVALLIAEKLNFDLYNISSPYAWSIEQWCALLAERYPDFTYTIQSDPGSSNIHLFDDNAPMQLDRLVEDTGYRARYDLSSSFTDYMDWVEQYEVMLPK